MILPRGICAFGIIIGYILVDEVAIAGSLEPLWNLEGKHTHICKGELSLSTSFP